MKRLTLLLLAGALVALILQPVSVPVNTQFDNNSSRPDGVTPPSLLAPESGMLLADGFPIPPCPPSGCRPAEGG